MTAAERQRRRRKRFRKEKLKLGRKAERERHLLEAAERYIPIPPGITYWFKVRLADGREIWQPTTQPLPSLRWYELRDEDLHALVERAGRELEGRRLRGEAGRGAAAGGLMAWGLTAVWECATEEERREVCERFREHVEAALAATRPRDRPRKPKGE